MVNTTRDTGASFSKIFRAVCRCTACGRKGPALASAPVFLRMEGTEGSSPYDAATATGMYDR